MNCRGYGKYVARLFICPNQQCTIFCAFIDFQLAIQRVWKAIKTPMNQSQQLQQLQVLGDGCTYIIHVGRCLWRQMSIATFSHKGPMALQNCMIFRKHSKVLRPPSPPHFRQIMLAADSRWQLPAILQDQPRSTSRWISKRSCSSSTSLPRARQAWDYCGEDGPSSRAKSSRFPTTRPQPPALAVWVQSRDPATWTRPPVGRGSGRTATTLGTCRWRCWGGGEEVGWRDKGQVGRICKQSCRAPSTRGFLGRGRDTGGCSSCCGTVKI